MRTRISMIAAAAMSVAGCSSQSSSSNSTAGAPYAVVAYSGSGQASTPGTSLATPLTVLVTASDGSPAANVTVNWTVTSGGGSVSPASTATASNGHAATILTLGASGDQSVRATVASATDTALFVASIGSSTATTSPQLITSVPTPANATYDHDTYVRDGLAFAFMWNAGVRIYDVGNGMLGGSPSNPQLVSSLITSANGVPGGAQVHNGWWFHNPVSHENRYLFIGQEGSCGTLLVCSIGDIHIVDVSDLTHPVEVGFIHIPGAGTHNFWMDEANQTLYAAYYNAGVVKIDVSGTLSGDMSSRIVATAKPGGANTYVWGVMLYNGTLYATDMLSGFWALDPVTLATKGGGNNVPERYGSDQWVYGNTAYSGTWYYRGTTRGNAVKVWSLSSTGIPTLADSLLIDNITTVSDVAVTPDGAALVITAEGGPGGGLYIYRRTDPLHPTLIGSYVVPVGLHTGEVAVIAGRTYVFAARDPGQQQMDIFDITDMLH